MTARVALVVWAIVASTSCGRLDFGARDDAPTSDGARAADAMASDASTTNATNAAFAQAAGQSSLTTSVTAPFTADVHAGDMVFVGFDWSCDPTNDPVTLTDSQGNAYQIAVAADSAEYAAAVLAYAVVGADGPDSVTATLASACGSNIELRTLDYAGLTSTNVLDVGMSAHGTTVAATSVGVTLTTTAPNELIVGLFIAHLGTVSADPGFMQRSSFDGDAMEDALVAAPGSSAVTARVSTATPWAAAVAAFR